MKHKTCVSIDEETLMFIKERVREGTFRNKSHAFEFAINRLKEEAENENN